MLEIKFKNKRVVQRDSRGFTLVELAIASSILAVIFGGITIFGVQVLRGFERSQSIKNTVENTSYAIEKLNKTIRTSHTIDGGGNEIFIIDNNTSESYCYFFDDNKLKLKTGNDSATDCGNIGGTASEIVGDSKIEISGSFSVKETDQTVFERGFVRTNIKIRYIDNNDVNDDEIVIQSSVSLRDYGF